jgi:MFS family permease
VLLYPVYALLFADAGLSTGAISSLFAIWSIVAFLAEVPSGALADTWSRRHLYALGALLTGLGYALWIIWPAYPGFALGFVLWGIGGAFASGTLEALVYDELTASADADAGAGEPAVRAEGVPPSRAELSSGGQAYARVMGRSGTVGILAMLAATLLATPAYAVGGYRLVGIASVAVVIVGGLLALRLPTPPAGRPTPPDDSAERPTPPADSVERPTPPAGTTERPTPPAGSAERPTSAVDSAESGAEGPASTDSYAGPVTEAEENPYWATVRDGLRESVRSRRIAWAVAIAALVPGFTALDEYLPLLSRDKGAPTTLVPLLFGLTALAMAAGSALAGRFPTLPRRRLAALLAAAAVLLAAGALLRSIFGMLAVSAAFGVLQFAMVLTETRLQEAIASRARTTVLSVSGFLSEVFAVALYALFALDAPLPALFALSAVPLIATASAIARYL